jgi:glycerate 2-kinase
MRIDTPHHALIAVGPFDTLAAERVAAAIARGLSAGGAPDPDVIELERGATPDIAAMLAASDFDARMRASRALIVAVARLHEETLSGSAAFEIATRARQSGVPAYAVTAENGLNSFDARILDLQVIIEADGTRALGAAGRKLAKLL